MVRKVPKYTRKTKEQIIVAPEAKDFRIVFGSKFWPRQGGESEKRLVAHKGAPVSKFCHVHMVRKVPKYKR
jgi:hypothetical protein